MNKTISDSCEIALLYFRLSTKKSNWSGLRNSPLSDFGQRLRFLRAAVKLGLCLSTAHGQFQLPRVQFLILLYSRACLLVGCNSSVTVRRLMIRFGPK